MKTALTIRLRTIRNSYTIDGIIAGGFLSAATDIFASPPTFS